ncbi:hypothetical protein BDF22DRAFT_746561 [Syncephalis plumigaleata]|nr:hypothetical protein BDF22DRAFT_746561 [Syncephalis plumigaleata]
MAKHKEFGLSTIEWRGGNKDQLRLAHVIWNNQKGFMKCDQVSSKAKGSKVDVFEKNIAEVYAFKALMEAKRLTGDYAIGRENVMDPLHQFGFEEANGNKYFCHIYSYINGETLEDYFTKVTISQAFLIGVKVLPEVIKGAIYLYNAGIIHGDLFPRNVMLEKDTTGKIAGVRIIDFDLATIIKGKQGWQPINPKDQRHLSPKPPQQYLSCNKLLKDAIAGFLNVFVYLEDGENPFDPSFVLNYESAQDYLERLREEERYAKVQLGDVNAASPAILYLLKVYYTTQSDPFICSSPIFALRGLPPRKS